MAVQIDHFVAHDLTQGAPALFAGAFSPATTVDPAASSFLVGSLPSALRPDAERFEALWRLHPAEYHEIQMYGRPVKTPRYQQAYGADYP